MRKEVILAIVFGGILGGVILFGINLANKSVQSNNPDSTPSAQVAIIATPSPTPAPEKTAIIFPEDHSVFFENTTVIKGTTKPNSSVVILTESNDIITSSDASGNFSSPIELISGENQIEVTGFDSNDSSTSAKITIIYTTSKFE